MSLKEYKRKRDFKKTPEPSDKSRAAPEGNLFVVQAHDASHMHFDFRLQLGDVLKSWAVPKGPSLVPGDKRLAVEVEDHPLAYASFEGVIPQGEYGGGTVMVWDTGRWIPHEADPAKALQKGKLSFTLAGERLKGDWSLTRMAARNGERTNWLLIKRSGAGTGKTRDPLKKYPVSVKSGRTLQQIAEEAGAVWRSGRKRKVKRGKPAVKAPAQPAAKPRAKRTARPAPKSRRRASRFDPAEVSGARQAPLPRTLSPQLATLADAAPAGEGWIHEIKFDGYRLLCQRSPAGVRLITRSGKDWTHRFAPIAAAVAELPVDTAVIDGEATIVDSAGRTSFQDLQGAIKEQKFDRLAFYAFDLPYCNGYDLTGAPLRQRKALLQQLIPNGNGGLLRYSDHIEGHGKDFHNQACRIGLEGIVSKQEDSLYQPRRTRTWLKVKCQRRQEFVVMGWTPPGGSRKHFGSLLLAAHDEGGRLVYTGRVGTGFNAATLRMIGQRLKTLARDSAPTTEPPPRSESRGAHWVDPVLVAEVEFTEWTGDGRLRHPSFQGLREDKTPESVKIEVPVKVESVIAEQTFMPQTRTQSARSRGKSPTRTTAGEEDNVVAGVKLTSPDRVLYPQSGLTKLQVAQYYAAVADEMLPYVVDRPLSTVRCPQGRAQKCFFQKHLGDTFGPPVRAIRVREKSGVADYIGIDSSAGLITLIQFGVLEIHPWGARQDDIEKPDWMTFDLDPGEYVAFAQVVEGALRIRELLTELDLVSFVKTSGGKGLHVVVPLRRRSGWDDVRQFAADVATRLGRDEPQRYLANMSKAKRRGRIFIDYLRNGRGATSVAPWSTRARGGAPVSMPVDWTELESLKGAGQFTVSNAVEHLRSRRRDPWAQFFKVRQQLTAARLRAVHGPS